VLVDNLPGAPDGVGRASGGGFWVPIIVSYPPLVRLAASRTVRALLSWAPPGLRPPARPRGLVLKVSEAGEVEFGLGDPGGRAVKGVTATTEGPGPRLWLGSLHELGVQSMELAPALAALRAGGGPTGAAAGAALDALAAKAAAAASGGGGEGGAAAR
jgi:hypothetical protein